MLSPQFPAPRPLAKAKEEVDYRSLPVPIRKHSNKPFPSKMGYFSWKSVLMEFCYFTSPQLAFQQFHSLVSDKELFHHLLFIWKRSLELFSPKTATQKVRSESFSAFQPQKQQNRKTAPSRCELDQTEVREECGKHELDAPREEATGGQSWWGLWVVAVPVILQRRAKDLISVLFPTFQSISCSQMGRYLLSGYFLVVS